jgi:hypothetical protein
MKLSEVKTVTKPGTRSGADALETFFKEMGKNEDAVDAFLDKMIWAGGGVTTDARAGYIIYVTPNPSGYTVRVSLWTPDPHTLVLGGMAPDGSTIEEDSPTETSVVFSLPASTAIDVAVADEDDTYETTLKIIYDAGGFLCRVIEVFGQTAEYRSQTGDE